MAAYATYLSAVRAGSIAHNGNDAYLAHLLPVDDDERGDALADVVNRTNRCADV